MDLSGKKILLFHPYGSCRHYGMAMINEMERRGAKVTEYDERPSQSGVSKTLIKIFKRSVPQFFNNYIKHIIAKHNKDEFDYIIIVRGEAFTKETCFILREKFSHAKIILYLWDTLEVNNLAHLVPYCDRALSFDMDDSQTVEGLVFRPTFFVPDYLSLNQEVNKEYDICFIGTVHSNRHNIIDLFKEKFEYYGYKSYFYLYLPSVLMYLAYSVTKFPYISIKRVNFSPISLNDTVKVVEKSKCILDINYSTQTSLSMRALEALAAKRKYITTNPRIKDYDFYDSDNILIIDISNPVIPNSFVSSPYKSINTDILKKYSVETFIDDLLG